MGKDKFNPYRKPHRLNFKPPVVKERIVITRGEWNAEPPHPEIPLEPTDLPVENVILTYNTQANRCEDTDACKIQVKKIQEYHMTRGLPDIPFNFLIGGDLRIYEGRGWDFKPEKNEQFGDIHNNTIEIALIGNYIETGIKEMGNLLLEAFHLVNLGVEVKNVTKFFHVKERTPKLRIETLGSDERPYEIVPHPRQDILLHDIYAPENTRK